MNRPKAKHRLPTATSVDSISLSNSALLKTSKGLLPRESNKDRIAPISLKASNGVHVEPAANPDAPATASLASALPASGAASMPPPVHPASRTQESEAAPQPHPAKSDVPHLSRPMAKPGFRPIGAVSSSMKRFFPGDEEEDNAATPSPVAHIDSSAVEAEQPSSRRTPDRDIVVPVSGPSAGTSRAHTPMPLVAENAVPDQTAEQMPPVVGDVSDHVTNGHVSGTNNNAGAVAAPVTQELYAIVSQVGEGTFGKVYKARNTVSGVHVALKRIRMEAERDGFPVTAMREIKLLQSLRHDNIVRLYEMMVSNGELALGVVPRFFIYLC
jgi:CTD kinase subunit alpha